jgi:hypothetical protein
MVNLNLQSKNRKTVGEKMRHWYKEYIWLRRLLASDPGQIRLYKAGKATFSLILSLFTTFFIINTTGNEALMPAVVSAAIGMMGIMVLLMIRGKRSNSPRYYSEFLQYSGLLLVPYSLEVSI